jgi:hypothetical protein
MLLHKHDLEKGDVRVAGGGTTALGIIGTVLGAIGTAGVAGEGRGHWLGGLFGGRGGFEGGCGDAADRHIRRREAELLTALASTSDKWFTTEKVCAVEEKFECMLKPIYHQLKCLEINAAVDNAKEATAAKYQEKIDKLYRYIDELQDSQYVKKISGPPVGGRFVFCHPEDCDRDEDRTRGERRGERK